MRIPAQAIVIVLPVLIGLGFVSTTSAQPAQPDVLPREFECMAKSSLGGSKVVVHRTKCAIKCFDSLWDGEVPESDCLPPYANRTAECVASVDAKVAFAVLDACTTGPGADCPECYTPSGCGTEQAESVPPPFAALVDALVPNLFCERAGAVPSEQRCQLNAAKRVAKHHAAVTKCYRKCFVNARSGGDVTTCMPPATDPGLLACVSATRARTSASIDRYCDDARYPDAPPECAYPDGSTWAALVEAAVADVIPDLYCAS